MKPRPTRAGKGVSFRYSEVHRIVYPRRHEGIYKNRGDNPWVSVGIRQGVGRDPSKIVH